MPLRAKITNPAIGGERPYSKPNLNEGMIQQLVKEQPGDEPDDVKFETKYGVRTIEMNRPKKLNSLNGSMARKIIARLAEWEKSQLATAVIIKGAGRAFCAGGDVAALAKYDAEGPQGQARSSEYFALEYKLDHLIASYQKPYIAFIDGITMGGGVGLSVHAPFRIATENTVFAMPETTIGFFPEVGASFFLPRMDGRMGLYLALTSEQLKGVDVFYNGIATHYIHSSTLPDLEARLGELAFKDYLPLVERHAIINATIEEFCTGLPSPRPAISGALRRAVDECFSAQNSRSPTDILAALKNAEQNGETDQIKTWAKKTAATINERSPISVAVTLRQLQVSGSWNIAETFQHEYNIASRFMAHPDFVTGVTARLIDRIKTRPEWKPNTLKEVTDEEVDSFFDKEPTMPLLVNNEETAKYKEYPHAWIGLPREREIVNFMQGKPEVQKEEVVKYFADRMKGKQGVKEKVEEVFDRMTDVQ